MLLLPFGEVEALAQQAPAQTSPSAQAGYNPQYDPYYGQSDPDAPPQPNVPPPQDVQPQQYGQPAYGAGYGSGASSGAAQPLPPQRLEQLAAPIALYPDALVAQVLAASTYPTQVVQADRWLHAMGYASPDQIAAGADQQPWDPSVKALTAFPQVLAQMDRNLQWTSDLGNAYYNQPQDVLESIQVLRQRAQAAGNLQSTPQETVSYDQGSIALAPPNPQVVYVPYYNPWVVYGQPVAPYPGFSLLGAIGSVLSASSSFLGSGFGAGLGRSPIQFGSGILLSAFSRTPWGALAWALSWLNLSVLFNHSNYYSHSATVADWGLPHGGWRAAAEAHSLGRAGVSPYRAQASFNRGNDLRTAGYRGGGYAPDGYHAPNRQQNYAASLNGYGGNRPFADGRSYPGADQNRYAYSQNNYVRQPQVAYGRPPQASSGAQYPRAAYGSGYNAGQSSAYAARSGSPYAGAQQPYRSPAIGFQQGGIGNFGKQSFGGNGFGGNKFAEPKAPRPSNNHPFGGKQEARSFGGPKGFSFKHSSGGHGGGKHRL